MRWISLLAGALALVAAVPASAAEGEVVLTCSRWIVVETMAGYALLEWQGGAEVEREQRVVGDFETYGMKTIYALPRGRETRVWVQDFWLTRERIEREIRERC